ncbi:MAG: DNA polymerase III subunit delta' [Acidobacteria bacterium]|nr:DNA polymerase III subunit delta' [Acidobacteriota bacterium]
MGFSEFHGNEETVSRLRNLLAQGRLPHSVILSGPQGSGKYTLATMIAQALNCETRPLTDGLPDFCGQCGSCARIGEAADLDTRVAESLEARDAMKESEKKETRLFVQTHPDVLVIAPDPPQMMIKVDQVRRVVGSIYFRPLEARERVFIFTDGAFMKEAANSLLKALEEPPECATIFILAKNAGELLPTIRSRCMVFSLHSLSTETMERYLLDHCRQWKESERALVSRLSHGAVGRARSFDLPAYCAARHDALILLKTAFLAEFHTELFKVTETYRAGSEGREKMELLLRCLYSLLEDLLFLNAGAGQLLRNTDIRKELEKLAEEVDFDWLSAAALAIGEVERGMRRNLLRSLSLDGLEAALENHEKVLSP